VALCTTARIVHATNSTNMTALIARVQRREVRRPSVWMGRGVVVVGVVGVEVVVVQLMMREMVVAMNEMPGGWGVRV
jgi:hypothetical protein